MSNLCSTRCSQRNNPGHGPVMGPSISGQTYTLGYDAENHLMSVTSPSLSASFVYNGDGKRVKSTINGVITIFLDNHYEIANGVVTKYYFAGTTRIAKRTGTSLNFIAGTSLI